MAGTLTPPFIPPDITDPPGTANAGDGYQEFQDLKNYVTSFLQVQFDLATGQFLGTVVFPAHRIPPLTGDVTNPTPNTMVATVVGINGQNLAALATGLLKNTTATGVPVIAVPGTDYQAVITPGQTPATATNDNATAGNVGEIVSSYLNSGAGVAFTASTPANVTSISLTAGDWDVEGNLNMAGTTATVAGSTAGISIVSVTLPSDGSECYSGAIYTAATVIDSITLPRKRISIASTTSAYLVAGIGVSAGTVNAFGGITARRVR